MQESTPAGRIVGIDLGTTNSLVAYMQDGAPAIIPGEDGDRLVPSVVAFDEDGAGFHVGNAARATLIKAPGNAVYSAKRLMGRGVAEVTDELKLFPFRLVDDADGSTQQVLRSAQGDINERGRGDSAAGDENGTASADVIRLRVGGRSWEELRTARS